MFLKGKVKQNKDIGASSCKVEICKILIANKILKN
jgi:hypothetical protein